MRIFFIIFGTILLGVSPVKAQLEIGLESNSQYYIDDEQIQLSDEEAKDRVRTNTYLTGTYRWKNFTAGLQLEAYESKALLNYSPELKGAGIGTAFINYNNTDIGLDITAGHIYEQFGSGLALRTWEDRALGIANPILGGRIKYSHPSGAFTIKTLAGKQRNGFKTTDATIVGADVETSLNKIFKSDTWNANLGFSYVNNHESNGAVTVNHIDPDQTVLGPRLSIDYKNFNFGVEYLHMSEYTLRNIILGIDQYNTFPGNAWLVNFGYSKTGLGFSGTLRRLENFRFYSQRELIGNNFNEALLNYVPTLTKQFDYSLANIYVYQPQSSLSFFPVKKSGEIGSQFDFYYTFKKGSKLGGKYGTQLSLNMSHWYGLKTTYTENGNEKMYKADFLTLGRRYYTDHSMLVRKKMNKKWSGAFMFLKQYYNTLWVEETSGEVNAYTAAVENTIRTGERNSVRFELQHQWADSYHKNWAAGLVEYNFKRNWSVFASDMYNYGNDSEDLQLHYYNFGMIFRKNATRVQASYGRQRGGLVCVGGVCRFVPENNGFSLFITTNF